MEGRYQLYGFVPEEHEEGNPDFQPRPSDQRVQRDRAQVVYATDDRWEAKRIVNIEGGFVRNDTWIVVIGALDTEGGGILGYVPEEPADGAA